MLVVRDAITGKALAITPNYKGVSATTTAAAGFETLTVMVEAASVRGKADTQWLGQEILLLSREGTVWEGVIEQVQKAQGYYSVFAVGVQLWELAAAALYGTYYSPGFEAFEDVPEDLSLYTKDGLSATVEEDKMFLGVEGDTMTLDGAAWGMEYKSPYAGEPYGDIGWFRFSYKRIGVPDTGDAAGTSGLGGSYNLRVEGVTGATTDVLLTVALTASDASDVQFEWSDPGTAYDTIRFLIVKVGDGQTLDQSFPLVRIVRMERSLMETHPTITDTIIHLFARVNRVVPVQTAQYPVAFVQEEHILTGTSASGQEFLTSLIGEAEKRTGIPQYYGTYEGYGFRVFPAARRSYVITDKDAGEDAVYSVVRGQPSVGGNTSGVFTHVRAHYVDDDGYGRFTDLVPTGLSLPRQRIETIEATEADTADADAEARALFHASISPRGTLVVQDTIRTLYGGYIAVSSVRAGDWVTLNTVTVSGSVSQYDLKRGGMIGKTTYNGDSNEVTIELLGNREE